MKALLTSLSFLMAASLLMVPTTATAHYNHYYHTHTYYRTRYVRVRTRPRPRPQKRFQEMLGIGIRFGGFYLEGTKFNLSNLENPMAGGLGVQFRSKFSPHWGLEFAVEYFRGKKENITQQTIPISLNALFYLLPKSRIQPYLLGGVGAHFTKIAYENNLKRSLTEVVAIFGGGVEIRIGRSFSINADVRGLAVWKIIGDQMSIPVNCGKGDGACTGVQTVKTTDKFNMGFQFLAALNYYF